MVTLIREDMHASVSDPVATSMNFLNEVAGRYPKAISLAAGRPYDDFYEISDISRYADSFVSYLSDLGRTDAEIRRTLMQYGRTNGVIHELIARWLEVDEGIVVPSDAVMVTAGCQEAMVIALRGLHAKPSDVLLVAAPCYVGITGAARILGIEVVPVPESPDGIDPSALAAVAQQVKAAGKTPRALYLVPDFANPTGTCLSLPVRRRLLEVASEEDLIILEDDPYGLFGLDDSARPKLKSLDTEQRVIYLGSFAKSVFPGARVGFLVADQTVVAADGSHSLLAHELSNIKSMLTVNTSPIAQAVIGGVLVESGFSLRAANQRKIAFYRNNLTHLLSGLDEHFPGKVHRPLGGFFATVEVPVVADVALLELSAAEFGVLWTPMSFFYTDGGGSNAIRLSCSALTPVEIDEGIRRLATLIASRTP